MRNHLPLNALRAFEAAARHTSFRRAAEELCVTPTAISHQIRTLEDFLDVTLFERRSGRLVLTSAAAAALADLSEGFDKLETAMRPLSRRTSAQMLAIAASPSVASLWLMPRLQRFVNAAPDIGISVSTVIDPTLFGEAGFDIAICNTPEIAGRKVDYLMSERILPVCAPRLLADRGDGIRTLLAELPLIHDDKPNEQFPKWQAYLDRIGVTRRDAGVGLRFNQSSLAIEAAIAGHGVLLGRSRLVATALEAGHLVAVDDERASFTQHYYIARPSGGTSSAARLFVDWLAAEAWSEEHDAALPGLVRGVTARSRPFSPWLPVSEARAGADGARPHSSA